MSARGVRRMRMADELAELDEDAWSDDELDIVDGAVRCERVLGFEDWYVIERVAHDHKQWLEAVRPSTLVLCDSARLGNASIEGYASEMIALARAILAGERFEARRCACATTTTHVLLWSPRNSRIRGAITHDAARALATQIFDMFNPKALP